MSIERIGKFLKALCPNKLGGTKGKDIIENVPKIFEVPSVPKNGGGLEALGNYNKAFKELPKEYTLPDGTLKTIDPFTVKVPAEGRGLGYELVSKPCNENETCSIIATKLGPKPNAAAAKTSAPAAKTSAPAADNAERLLKIDGDLKSALLEAMDTPNFKLDKNLVRELIEKYPEPIEKLAKITDSKNKQMFSAAEIVTLLGNAPTSITKRADEVFAKLEDPNTLKYLEGFEKNRAYVLWRLIVG